MTVHCISQNWEGVGLISSHTNASPIGVWNPQDIVGIRSEMSLILLEGF